MTFDPNKHITGLPRKQKRSDGTYETVKDEYLEVKWRLVWFREECPQGVITTEEIFVDLDRVVEVEATRWVDNPAKPGKKMQETYTKSAKGYARYKATVKDGKGGEATGTKSESAVDFPDYIEKSETGAIGRALAALGFGTQFTGEEFNEKHRIVDSPVREDVNEASATNAEPTTPQAAPVSEKPAETPATNAVDYHAVYKAGKTKNLWSAANGFYAFASHVLSANVNDGNVKNLAKPNLERLLKAIEEAEPMKQTAKAS